MALLISCVLFPAAALAETAPAAGAAGDAGAVPAAASTPTPVPATAPAAEPAALSAASAVSAATTGAGAHSPAGMPSGTAAPGDAAAAPAAPGDPGAAAPAAPDTAAPISFRPWGGEGPSNDPDDPAAGEGGDRPDAPGAGQPDDAAATDGDTPASPGPSTSGDAADPATPVTPGDTPGPANPATPGDPTDPTDPAAETGGLPEEPPADSSDAGDASAAYAIFDWHDGALTFKRCKSAPKATFKQTVYCDFEAGSCDDDQDECSVSPWSQCVGAMKSVVFASLIQPTDTSGWFSGCRQLTSVEGLGNLDMSNVVSMNGMFSGCSQLTQLDVSNWNVSNVRDMSQAFSGCTALAELDVANWNVSRVERFDQVFEGCESLTALDVTHWDMASAVDVPKAFTVDAADASLAADVLAPRQALALYLSHHDMLDALLESVWVPDASIVAGERVVSDTLALTLGTAADAGAGAASGFGGDLGSLASLKTGADATGPATAVLSLGSASKSSSHRGRSPSSAGQSDVGVAIINDVAPAMGDTGIASEPVPASRLGQAIDDAIEAATTLPPELYWMTISILALVSVFTALFAASLIPRRR